MDSCKSNAFCSSLPIVDRDKLCKHCIKTSLAAGTSVKLDPNHPYIVVEGLILVTGDNKPTTIIVPGDLTLTPRFRPQQNGILAITDEDYRDYLHSIRLAAMSNIVLAMFSTRIINDMLETAPFARAALDSMLNQTAQISYYQRELHNGTAYDSVRYVLKVARAYNVKKLTHEKIGLMAGRSRTTVTQIMHEIALADPELLA